MAETEISQLSALLPWAVAIHGKAMTSIAIARVFISVPKDR